MDKLIWKTILRQFIIMSIISLILTSSAHSAQCPYQTVTTVYTTDDTIYFDAVPNGPLLKSELVAQAYFSNSNEAKCPMSVTLENNLGGIITDNIIRINNDGFLEVDQNQYETNKQYEYRLKAETEVHLPVYKKIIIMQKRGSQQVSEENVEVESSQQGQLENGEVGGPQQGSQENGEVGGSQQVPEENGEVEGSQQGQQENGEMGGSQQGQQKNEETGDSQQGEQKNGQMGGSQKVVLEGMQKYSTVLTERSQITHNLQNCNRFFSNLLFNIIICDKGRMVLQDAKVGSHTTIFSIPSNILGDSNEKVQFYRSITDPRESFMVTGGQNVYRFSVKGNQVNFEELFSSQYNTVSYVQLLGPARSENWAVQLYLVNDNQTKMRFGSYNKSLRSFTSFNNAEYNIPELYAGTQIQYQINDIGTILTIRWLSEQGILKEQEISYSGDKFIASAQEILQDANGEKIDKQFQSISQYGQFIALSERNTRNIVIYDNVSKSMIWKKSFDVNQTYNKRLFQMGPITHQYDSQRLPQNFFLNNAKLAYYVQSGDQNEYNEVHLYPSRGEKNLNGWSEFNQVDDNIDLNRQRKNQNWDSFEMNNLHQIENLSELTTGAFNFYGTNLIYNNGQDRDIKTYQATGFHHKVIDQHDQGGKDVQNIQNETNPKRQLQAQTNAKCLEAQIFVTDQFPVIFNAYPSNTKLYSQMNAAQYFSNDKPNECILEFDIFDQNKQALSHEMSHLISISNDKIAVNLSSYVEGAPHDFYLRATVAQAPSRAPVWKSISVRQCTNCQGLSDQVGQSSQTGQGSAISTIESIQYVNESLIPNVVITSFLPAKAEVCPSGYGVADVFTNKLQGKECIHCKQIYQAAKKREEAGEGEQFYDIHVAKSLCSQGELDGSNMYWQSNLMVIFFYMVAVIVLCSMFEMYKNREIAENREKDFEAQKYQVKNEIIASQRITVEENLVIQNDMDKNGIVVEDHIEFADTARSYAPDTERKLVNYDIEVKETFVNHAYETNGTTVQPKASRVVIGDHSVIQDDYDFSNDDIQTANISNIEN